MFKWMIAALIAAMTTFAADARAQWYASVDFMTPVRVETPDTIFQRNQTTAGRVGTTALLTTDRDLELDFAAAGKVTVGYRPGMFGLEGSYLATTKWTETASVFSSTGALASPFTAPGALVNPAFDNNTSAILEYTTELDTAEINLTQLVYMGPNGNASLIYGARFWSLEESLIYATDNAVADHTVVTTTDNRMAGPQLGLLVESPVGGGQINFVFKSTLGYNTVEKSTLFDGALSEGRDANAALMSEIGVNCIFFPSANVSVQVGYQLLAATDMALATQNFETNLSAIGAGLVNVRTDGGVIYHTPYVGVVFMR
jgi:hypothetical protein